MIFYELKVHTNSAGYEFISAILSAHGITCLSVEDPADLLEIMENKSIPYVYIGDGLPAAGADVIIKAYFADNAQGVSALENVRADIAELKKSGEFELGSLETETDAVDDRDWENNWKEFFRPLELGSRYAVKPSWEEYRNDGRIVIEIDPGSSFGTGQHETTALCLELLEAAGPDGKNILDIGCGSGILGIGAALSGAAYTVMADIDRYAADIAEKNSLLNGLDKNLFCVECGDIICDRALYGRLSVRKYDIILANIAADVIIPLTEKFFALLTDGGALICSGIISDRRREVSLALEKSGLYVEIKKEKNDWIAFLCRKKM